MIEILEITEDYWKDSGNAYIYEFESDWYIDLPDRLIRDGQSLQNLISALTGKPTTE